MGLVPDFLLDYISVNDVLDDPGPSFMRCRGGAARRDDASSGRSVRTAARAAAGRVRHALSLGAGPRYATAVCVLWVVDLYLRSVDLYASTASTCACRSKQEGFFKTQGVFELKEHIARMGLGLLPVYWYLWKNARDPLYERAQMADRRAGCDVLVHVLHRPHRQQRARLRIMSMHTRTAQQHRRVPTDLPDSCLAFASPMIYMVCDMAALPMFTYHPGTDRRRIGFTPADPRPRAGDVLVWLDRELCARRRHPRRACRHVAGTDPPQNSISAGLDRAPHAGAGADLFAEILLAVGVAPRASMPGAVALDIGSGLTEADMPVCSEQSRLRSAGGGVASAGLGGR